MGWMCEISRSSGRAGSVGFGPGTVECRNTSTCFDTMKKYPPKIASVCCSLHLRVCVCCSLHLRVCICLPGADEALAVTPTASTLFSPKSGKLCYTKVLCAAQKLWAAHCKLPRLTCTTSAPHKSPSFRWTGINTGKTSPENAPLSRTKASSPSFPFDNVRWPEHAADIHMPKLELPPQKMYQMTTNPSAVKSPSQAGAWLMHHTDSHFMVQTPIRSAVLLPPSPTVFTTPTSTAALLLPSPTSTAALLLPSPPVFVTPTCTAPLRTPPKHHRKMVEKGGGESN